VNITYKLGTYTKVKGNFIFFQLAGLLLYIFFSWLMLKITLQYIPYNTDAAFLRIKQDVIDVPFYKLAFFTHVYTAILALPAGVTQFSTYIRRKLPYLHKFTGWIYATVIILLAGPAGFYMGVYANGGPIAEVSFCILACLWIYFTSMAIVKVKEKNILSHRAFFIRSFSLTLSALTLRGWKYLIILFFHPRPMDAYQVVAWLGLVPNLILAELIIRKLIFKRK